MPAVFPVGQEVDLIPVFLVNEHGVRIEGPEHAVDAGLHELLGIDFIDVIGRDFLVNAAEDVDALVDLEELIGIGKKNEPSAHGQKDNAQCKYPSPVPSAAPPCSLCVSHVASLNSRSCRSSTRRPISRATASTLRMPSITTHLPGFARAIARYPWRTLS